VTLLNAHVLKPATAREIEAMGLYAERVADRWASGWPQRTRALERQGELLRAVREQAAREAAIYSTARQGGENSHLADHEVATLFDLDPAPPG